MGNGIGLPKNDTTPITHRFTVEEEERLIKDMCRQTLMTLDLCRLIVQYTALCPGETPDTQVYSVRVPHLPADTCAISHETWVSLDTRSFDNGLQLVDENAVKDLGFISTNQPRIHHVNPVADPNAARFAETADLRFSSQSDTHSRMEGSILYKMGRTSGSAMQRIARAHIPIPTKRLKSCVIYATTDTFAFFYNFRDHTLWASPWVYDPDKKMEVDTNGGKNGDTTSGTNGFQVKVEREGVVVSFLPNRSILQEIDKGRFVEIIYKTAGFLDLEIIDVMEYRFDDRVGRSHVLLQRKLKPPPAPISFSGLIVTHQTIARGNKLILISTNNIGVMFFTSDAWSFEWYPRHDLHHVNPRCNNTVSCRSKSCGYQWSCVCGDWLVRLFQGPDGRVSVTRISLDTRFLTAPTYLMT